MKIKTTYEEITRALAAVVTVVSDKLLLEDLKTFTFWKSADKISVVAKNAYVSAMTELNATIEFADGEENVAEFFIQLKANDLKNILATYSGLHFTKVTAIEFDIRDNEIRLGVTEEAVDKESEGWEKYTKTAWHKLMRVRVTETMKREILEFRSELAVDNEKVEVQSAELLGYLEPLLPMINKSQNDSPFTRMFIMKDNIFVVPQTFAAIIENRLDDNVKAVFSQFILTSSVATFLKSFLALSETVKITKVIKEKLVNLIMETKDTKALIHAYDDKKVFNIDNYNIEPENWISINRAYFADVLKRINNTGADITFKIELNADSAKCCIINKAINQEIPINKYHGEGEFMFTIKSELLASVTFNNMLEYFGDKLIFRFDHDDTNKVNFFVHDNTKGWHTKMIGLSVVKSDFQNWQ